MASTPAVVPTDANTVPIISREQGSHYYFGFGSNMWVNQMKGRCPDSLYVGIAILKGWKWIINQRGYANVVPSVGDIVYGLAYKLNEIDEDTLDRCEGVPWAYTKEIRQVELFRKGMGLLGGSSRGEMTNGLVYIDVERVHESDPRDEYIDRMNMAIEDALKEGVPQWYIDKYLRKRIPERRSLSPLPRDIFLGGSGED